MALTTAAYADPLTCPESESSRMHMVRDAEARLSNTLDAVGYLTHNMDYTHQDKNETATREVYQDVCFVGTNGFAAKANALKAETQSMKDQCEACFNAKLEAYFKPFYKKHGRHLPDTDGYRTRIVVIYGEAETIPTDKQAEYDMLWDEYREEFDDNAARAECDELVACKQAALVDKQLQEYAAKAKLALDCDKISEGLRKVDEIRKEINFLKACKYAPAPTTAPAPAAAP